jgi:hypothetical protein
LSLASGAWRPFHLNPLPLSLENIPSTCPSLSRVKRIPNYGLHGKGELQWWALFVKAGQEKKVAEGLTKYMSELPPLDPLEEGGEPRERVVETRYPKKSLKVWNPK